MTKLELFEYLNSGIDKSGNLKKESGFKKHFPEIYDEFINTIFPLELQDLPFKQKVWHFLNDIFTIPVCKICGNPVNFLTRKGQWGYCTYCSGTCAMKDDVIKEKLDSTKLIKYGSRTYNNSEKQKQTISNKGDKYWKQHSEKSLKTRYEKNRGKYFSEETIQKIRNTILSRYGVDSFAKTQEFRDIVKEKHDEIEEKQYKTKKENNSFNTSSIEEKFKDYLDSLNIIYNRQFKSNQYPYSCDFFIPGLNLYIEIQGSWTHGKHPFNPDDKMDNEKLNYWKSKDNEYYNNAIYTWTDLDVRKRQCAKDNHINYLEIFSNDIDDCITIFENYITEKIVDYCLTQDLPGNGKWPANHPIWDCYVGKNISPRDAWSNRNYLEKAVKNIFYMLPKDEKFRIRHIKELLNCQILDNRIVYTSQKLLQMIQDRFTIAKIAPKVTAISGYSVKRIICESGINIASGVYVPMSGFGGIIDGVKLWGKEQNKEVECECYDINQRLCDWYGWKQRDMLVQKVVTDKVCICCPPFGKKYEHWDGTPDEMSDIDFKEWYKLIKQYVIAPEYIIIGPEIDKTGTGSNKGVDKDGKKQSGLFTKTVGVMRWTDDMVE